MTISNFLTQPMRVKDLTVFKYKDIFPAVTAEVDKAKEYGIDLENLIINPIIYENEMDIDVVIFYFSVMNAYIKIFGDIFSNEVYSMRINNIINDQIYRYIMGNNIFSRIFDKINNNLNIYLFDIYVIEETLTFYSEVSLESFIIVMESFNEAFIENLQQLVNRDYLNKLNIKRLSTDFNSIYEALFDDLSYVYLPFY